MKLTAPIYQWDAEGKIVVHYEGKSRGQALNFTGTGWVEHRYGLVQANISAHPVVLTDTDLLAQTDYAELLSDKLIVVAYNECAAVAASKRRLRNAVAKLRARGIKVRYFASMDKATKFIEGYEVPNA